MKLRVLLGQLSPKLGDVKENAGRIKEVIGEERVDLAVFPELFLTGYYSKDLLYRLAIVPFRDSVVEELRKAVEESGTAAVVGFPEKSAHGFLYNSALAINEEGELFVYRKRHLPTFSLFDEQRWFKPHKGPLKLWNVKGVRAGIAVCYDIFFPEIFKAYTLMGAQILVMISAAPDSSLKFFEKLSEARAIENTVYVVWVNQVGVYDGVGFAGGSRVVSPLGEVVKRCKLMDEDLCVAELELEEVQRARTVRPVLKDVCKEDVEVLLDAYWAFES